MLPLGGQDPVPPPSPGESLGWGAITEKPLRGRGWAPEGLRKLAKGPGSCMGGRAGAAA